MSVTRQTQRLSIGFVMLHTSPLDVPGTKDAGGMNVVVRAQSHALARAGHTVRIFTRRADPAAAGHVELAPGLTVIHLDAGPAQLLAKGDHESVLPAFEDALAAALEDTPVDLLHAEHWFSGIAAQPVARRLGVPLVQSFHSIAVAEASAQPGERPESPGRLAGERLLAREADLLVAVSEAERREIIADLGGDPARVLVVPLGVDAELFRPCSQDERRERAEWLRDGGLAEVLTVGRLHPLKAFDLAIAAVAAIPATARPSLRIIGASPPDGDEYAQGLHEQAARLGVLGTTSFDGALPRPELAKRIRRASLVLVPSQTETFGLVALEAAASGVPVVARAVGGLREAVVDGETGILVAGDDPEAWATEIAGLLADTERWQRMSVAAREHALSRSWAASAQALVAAYAALLDRAEPGLSLRAT